MWQKSIFFIYKKIESQKKKKKNIFFMIKFALKNAIFLVFPIEEISLPPELSGQPRFRIQEGGLSIPNKVRSPEDGNPCVYYWMH